MASRLFFIALLCLAIACTAVGGRLANAVGVRPLTEEDLDRSQAAASFALGKSLYARSDLAGALRAYQSAWRWDPSRRELLDDIVSLAVSLGRADEAIRYAIVQSESGGVTPELLRRLALYATESEQWEQAAVLYERWLAIAPERDASFEKALIRIELGRIYQQLGRFGDASRCVAEVQRTLLRTPNSEAARRLASALGGSLSQVYQTFGQCHLEAGEHTLASQAFAQLSNGDLPTGGGLQYWLAKLALAESQPLEAYSQLHAYFDSPGDPYGAEPYDLLRTTLIQLNDRGRLPAELSRIRQRRPQSLYALCADAHQLANSGRREEAAALLRRVIESAVSSEASIDQESFGESANWLIDFYAESDDANRLLPLLQQLTMVDPTLEKFTNSLTGAMDKKAFAAQMKTRLSMLLQTNPTEAERLLPASRLALILGENKLAVDLFRKAIELVEEARGSMCLDFAVDLLLAEQNNLAAELIRNSVDEGVLDSEAPATWYYLSAALSSQKGADEAVAAARRAAELAPDSPEFAAHVARTLQIAGRQEQAIEEYATLLERFDAESDSSVRQTLREARLSYSYLLLSEGEADAAVRELQLVLDEFPGDPGASNDLGYLWADRGLHPLRSVQLANDAVAAEPENPAYLDSLGWAFYKLGDLAQARNTLQRAVNATTVADPEILDHLGQTLAESGDVQAARQEWRRALAALADDAGRSELRDAIQKRLEPLEHDKQPTAPRGAE